jgi:hypothetical protein
MGMIALSRGAAEDCLIPSLRGGMLCDTGQHALAVIKAYVNSRPSGDVRAHRRHVWEAVIEGIEGYDEEATAEADPSHTSEQAVFADGSRLWWDSELNAWETGPASDQIRLA